MAQNHALIKFSARVLPFLSTVWDEKNVYSIYKCAETTRDWIMKYSDIYYEHHGLHMRKHFEVREGHQVWKQGQERRCGKF